MPTVQEVINRFAAGRPIGERERARLQGRLEPPDWRPSWPGGWVLYYDGRWYYVSQDRGLYTGITGANGEDLWFDQGEAEEGSEEEWRTMRYGSPIEVLDWINENVGLEDRYKEAAYKDSLKPGAPPLVRRE